MPRFEKKTSETKNLNGAFLALDSKAVSETGEFEGYASIFGNVDNGGDIVQFGAFDETLRERPAGKVKMLRQHNSNRVIGVWDQVYADKKGLYVRGHFILGNSEARDTYELVKGGALEGLSIGYRTKLDSYDSDTGIRTIVEADLWEISVVTFPMNQSATIENVKSHKSDIDNAETITDAEHILRDAGFSRQDAKGFISLVKKIDPREAGFDRTSGESIAIQNLARKLRA